jgi:hypothetical protein
MRERSDGLAHDGGLRLAGASRGFSDKIGSRAVFNIERCHHEKLRDILFVAWNILTHNKSGRLLAIGKNDTLAGRKIGRGGCAVFEVSQQVVSAFEAEARRKFIGKAVMHATAFDPAGVGGLPVDSRRFVVEQVIGIAERYAITDQAATILLIEATCVAGPGFPDRDEDGWARNLLETEREDEARTLTYVRDTALEKRGMVLA